MVVETKIKHSFGEDLIGKVRLAHETSNFSLCLHWDLERYGLWEVVELPAETRIILNASTPEQLVPFLALYGEKYRKTYLRGYAPERLLNDWWAGFKFFLGHACNVGRCDELSARVCESAVEVLSPLFSGLDGAKLYNENRIENWSSIEHELRERIGAGRVGKPGDILMVKGSLDFIADLPNLNIVRYSVDELRLGEIKNHYRRLDQIYQIGDKVASVYLRDVVSIFQLDPVIPLDDFHLLMPIDTHVRNVAQQCGIVEPNTGDQEIRKALVDISKRVGVSPLLVNQGAWHVRKNHPTELNAKLHSTIIGRSRVRIRKKDAAKSR